MVRCSTPLLIVFKRTGGRAWLKKWGFKGLSREQKANRRKSEIKLLFNRLALEYADQSHWAYLEETGQKPHWGESKEVVRQRKLDDQRRWELWRATREKYLPDLEQLIASINLETKRPALN
jgi:hypothetical protein